jgi:integrase/recombinase XerD
MINSAKRRKSIKMIKTEIISLQFKELETGFVKWLKTLNYSEETIKTRKRNIREFLLYLERCGITDIEGMNEEKVKLFANYLKHRENRRYGSGLMNASINVAIGSVNKFFEYLQQTEKPAPDNLQYLERRYKSRNILTMKEITQLYETTYQKHHFANEHTQAKQEAVSQRDRAMLSIYYGCGLRKSEGINLDTGDILIERKLIHVRKGKGSKERYVPVTENNMKYLTEYLNVGRIILLAGNETETDSFFINQYGEPCSDQALSQRLRRLVKNSGNSVLRAKNPTLHTLRHSIATHLLQQGMEMELIQKFLGHGSLQSTQIYTHIVNSV